MSHKCRAYSQTGIGRGKVNQKEIRQAFYKGWDMANDKVLELTNQAGFWEPMGLPSDWDAGDYVVSPHELQRFYELVRNEVLEEAAKVCESLDEASGPCSWHYEIATQDCATAIKGLKS